MSLIIFFIGIVLAIVVAIILLKFVILFLMVAVGLIIGAGVFFITLMNGLLEIIIRIFLVGFWFTKIFIPKLRPSYDKFKIWYDKNSAFRKY